MSKVMDYFCKEGEKAEETSWKLGSCPGELVAFGVAIPSMTTWWQQILQNYLEK